MENPTDIEIILIEDNPFDAELTLRALQKKGLAGRVKVFPCGVEALDFLFGDGNPDIMEPSSSSRPPKVIFLDLKLPKMNGLEILSQIKNHQRTRLIPVVVLTSSEEESDIQESYRLGVNSYMVKPVDYEEFLQAVEDLGDLLVDTQQGNNVKMACGYRAAVNRDQTGPSGVRRG